ncbi:MAG: 50S ribosomal protein L11 methyltransferase [Fimbriimonadaceae bacterium]|nr:50S ribosomal protein L11 methyltransferase [Fimbriimonadaceae bacterium]
MSGAHWREIRAHFFPWPVDISPFIDLYLTYGIENTSEADGWLSGCLPEVAGSAELAAQLATALREHGATEVEIRTFEEENWDQIWKHHFKPRRVGERLVIRPTWEAFAASPNDLVIELDPGQAFGTGDHATTRLCLELLESANPAGKQIADVGCGSGILAIAAKLLGAARVRAADIDPIAVEVARENAARNGVEIEFAVGGGFAPVATDAHGTPGEWGEDELRLSETGIPAVDIQVSEPTVTFDLVLSNIISLVLMRIAADAYAAVRPGGDWIVSGVIESNWPDVRERAESVGFRLVEQRQEDDWIGARFTK